MKKSGLIINVIFAVCIAVLFFLQLRNKGPEKTEAVEVKTEAETAEDTSTVPININLKPSDVVYVNTDSLWENFKMVKDIKTQLESSRKVSESQFQAKAQAFEAEVKEFQEKGQGMSQEAGMAKQQELMEKQQKLGELQNELSEKLLSQEQKKNEEVNKVITAYMQKNYKGKYGYILGYSATGGILYASDSLDITREVVEGLNREYRAKKKAGK